MQLYSLSRSGLAPERPDTGMLSLYSNEVARSMAKPVIDYLYMPNVHHASVLPSSSHVVWTMESLGHTLSWSFEDHAVMTAALDIYSKWIFDANTRPDAITANENGFFQIMFLHLSQIFDSHRRPRTGVGIPGRPLPYSAGALSGGISMPQSPSTQSTSLVSPLSSPKAGINSSPQSQNPFKPVLISQPDYPYYPRPGPNGVEEICGPGTAYRDRQELEHHVKLGHTALNILAAVARTFSLSQDTWRLLLRVLLGITNAVFCDPARSVHFASRIEFHLVQTLFDVWVRASPTDPSLWSAFATFSRGWLTRRWLIVHWRSVCQALTRALLSHIRSQVRGKTVSRAQLTTSSKTASQSIASSTSMQPNEMQDADLTKVEISDSVANLSLSSKTSVSSIKTNETIRLVVYWPESFTSSVNVSPLELTYLWWQFHNLLGSPLRSCGPDSFAVMIEGVADSAMQFLSHAKLRVSSGVLKSEADHATKIGDPIEPTFVHVAGHAESLMDELCGGPDLNQILALFGPWLFDGAFHSAAGYEDGRAVAIATLCRIFSKAPAAIHSSYRFLFLAAVCEVLRDQPPTSPVSVSVIAHSSALFSSGLPAVDVIVPYLIPHLSYILSCPEDIDVATRRGSLLALGSLVTLHAHLFALHTVSPAQRSDELEFLDDEEDSDTDEEVEDKLLETFDYLSESELDHDTIFGNSPLLCNPLSLPGTIELHHLIGAPASIASAPPSDSSPNAIRGLLAIRTGETTSGRSAPPPSNGSARYFPQALRIRKTWLRFLRQQKRLAKLLIQRQSKPQESTVDTEESIKMRRQVAVKELQSMPLELLDRLISQVPRTLPLSEYLAKLQRVSELRAKGVNYVSKVEFSFVSENGDEIPDLMKEDMSFLSGDYIYRWPNLARSIAAVPQAQGNNMSYNKVLQTVLQAFPCSTTTGGAGSDSSAAALVNMAEKEAATIAASAITIASMLSAPPSVGSTARSQDILSRLQTSKSPLIQHLLSHPFWAEDPKAVSQIKSHWEPDSYQASPIAHIPLPQCRCRLHRLVFSTLIRDAAAKGLISKESAEISLGNLENKIAVFSVESTGSPSNDTSSGERGVGSASTNKHEEGPKLHILETARLVAKVSGRTLDSGVTDGKSHVDWGKHPADPLSIHDSDGASVGILHDPIATREQLGSLPALLLSALTVESEGVNLELIGSLISNMVWQKAIESSVRSESYTPASPSRANVSSQEKVKSEQGQSNQISQEDASYDEHSENEQTKLIQCPVHMGILRTIGAKIEANATVWPESVLLSWLECIACMAPAHTYLLGIAGKGVEELICTICKLAVSALDSIPDSGSSVSPMKNLASIHRTAVALLRCIFSWISTSPTLLNSQTLSQLISKAISKGLLKNSQELYVVCLLCLKLVLHEAARITNKAARSSMPLMLRGLTDPAWPSPLHIGPLSRIDAKICEDTHQRNALDEAKFVYTELARSVSEHVQTDGAIDWSWASTPSRFAFEVMSSPMYTKRLTSLFRRRFSRSDRLLWRLLRLRCLVDGQSLLPSVSSSSVFPESRLLHLLAKGKEQILFASEPRYFLVNRKAVFSCCELDTQKGRELVVITRNVAGRRTWRLKIPADKLAELSRCAGSALKHEGDSNTPQGIPGLKQLAESSLNSSAKALITSDQHDSSEALLKASRFVTSGLLIRLFLSTFGLYEPLEGAGPGWLSTKLPNSQLSLSMRNLNLPTTASYSAAHGVERGAEILPLRDNDDLVARLTELDLLPTSETFEVALLLRRSGQNSEIDFCSNRVWDIEPLPKDALEGDHSESQEDHAVAKDANSRVFLAFAHALASHPVPDAESKLLLRVPSMRLLFPESDAPGKDRLRHLSSLRQVANCPVRIIWNEDQHSSWWPHTNSLLRLAGIQSAMNELSDLNHDLRHVTMQEAVFHRYKTKRTWHTRESLNLLKECVVVTEKYQGSDDNPVVTYIVITPLAHMGLYRVNLYAQGVEDDKLGFCVSPSLPLNSPNEGGGSPMQKASTLNVSADASKSYISSSQSSDMKEVSDASGTSPRSTLNTPSSRLSNTSASSDSHTSSPFGLQMRSTHSCMSKLSSKLSRIDEENASMAMKLAKQASTMSFEEHLYRAGKLVLPKTPNAPTGYGIVEPGPFGVVKLLQGGSDTELSNEVPGPISHGSDATQYHNMAFGSFTNGQTPDEESSSNESYDGGNGGDIDNDDNDEDDNDDEDDEEDEEDEDNDIMDIEYDDNDAEIKFEYESEVNLQTEMQEREEVHLDGENLETTKRGTRTTRPSSEPDYTFSEDQPDYQTKDDNDAEEGNSTDSEESEGGGAPPEFKVHNSTLKKLVRINSQKNEDGVNHVTQQAKSNALATVALARFKGANLQCAETGYTPTTLASNALISLSGNDGSSLEQDAKDSGSTIPLSRSPSSIDEKSQAKDISIASKTLFDPSLRRWHTIGPLIQSQLVGEASLVHVVRTAAEISYRRMLSSSSMQASGRNAESSSPFAIRHRKFVEIARGHALLKNPSEAFESIAKFQSREGEEEALKMFQHFGYMSEEQESM